MIKVIDIQNHIGKLLKDNFPDHKVYTEGNRKDMVKPTFSVSVRPLLTTGAMNYKNKLVNVDIAYLSEKETHAENIIMAERLEDIFHLVLTVNDRQLYIEDLSISETDTVLNLAFTLDYNINLVRIITNDYMNDLELIKGDE